MKAQSRVVTSVKNKTQHIKLTKVNLDRNFSFLQIDFSNFHFTRCFHTGEVTETGDRSFARSGNGSQWQPSQCGPHLGQGEKVRSTRTTRLEDEINWIEIKSIFAYILNNVYCIFDESIWYIITYKICFGKGQVQLFGNLPGAQHECAHHDHGHGRKGSDPSRSCGRVVSAPTFEIWVNWQLRGEGIHSARPRRCGLEPECSEISTRSADYRMDLIRSSRSSLSLLNQLLDFELSRLALLCGRRSICLSSSKIHLIHLSLMIRRINTICGV